MKFHVSTPFPAGKSLVRVGQVKMPASFTAHLTDDEHGGPDIDLVFKVRDGAPECREVHIRATGGGHEVRYSGIAGIRREDVLEEAVMALLVGLPAEEGNVTTYMPLNPSGFVRRNAVHEVRSARSARKVKMTDELLQEVAEVYRANVKGHPTQAVAEHFDRAHRTAALYVKQAREAGFLGATTKGKAGEQ